MSDEHVIESHDAEDAEEGAASGNTLRREAAAGPGPTEEQSDRPDKKKKKKGKKKAEEEGLGSRRGIETMFKTSYQTHNDLSGLADNKANIMISINGIIISITIASVGPSAGQDGWLRAVLSVLLVGCLVSMIFAVLAARPRITRRPASSEEIMSGKANILFFGNFIGIPEEQFVEGMLALMSNTDRVYLNMIRDIYALGGVLERKFRLLRISYTTFMVGLVLGVLLLVGGMAWTSM